MELGILGVPEYASGMDKISKDMEECSEEEVAEYIFKVAQEHPVHKTVWKVNYDGKVISGTIDNSDIDSLSMLKSDIKEMLSDE